MIKAQNQPQMRHKWCSGGFGPGLVQANRKLRKKYVSTSQELKNGVVVRASASQSVDQGFIPLVESYQKTLKNDIYSIPAWRLAFMGGCGEQAGKFACCVLGQGTSRDAPRLCGRQVTRKWQLPSDCGLTVQNIAIHRFLVKGG